VKTPHEEEDSGKNSPPTHRRDRRVKKDIFAVITFLLTGLIFFLTRLDRPTEQAAAFRDGATTVEMLSTDATSKKPLHGLLPSDLRSRDS
jgi:hypothetical protein